MLYTLAPARDILARPVGWLARQIRRAIAEQGTTRAQAEAYYALQRRAPGRMLPVFGDAGMHVLTFSNWCRADFYGHDFSPARVDGGAGGVGACTPLPVYPSYIQALQLSLEFPEGTLIVGRDREGNYWLYLFRVRGLWAKVEKALDEMDVDI